MAVAGRCLMKHFLEFSLLLSGGRLVHEYTVDGDV